MKIKADKQEKDLHFKLLILGESSIGKTCLMERYVKNSFQENHINTIGIDIQMKRLEINNCDINIAINDTAGQEKYRAVTKNIYKEADGILVGFDLTNKNTFEQVSYWIEQIEANKSKDYPLSLVLFGNKCDMKEDIIIKDNDIKSMKMKYNLDYFETSAKDGTNVQKIFEYLIKIIIKTRRLFDKIGLSSNIPIDDIIIKEKEIQKLEIKYSPKKSKKKPCCI